MGGCLRRHSSAWFPVKLCFQDARDGKLDPVIGRDEEIRRCIQILSRRTKNNPVLIGEPGVGKVGVLCLHGKVGCCVLSSQGKAAVCYCLRHLWMEGMAA